MRIVCENHEKEQIEFTYDFPFFLRDISGATDASYTVTTEQIDGQDGEHYSGAVAPKRNIVITAAIDKDFSLRRDQLYRLFQPRRPGTLYLYDQNDGRKIEYYAESISVASSGALRDVVISLICPDPLFQSLEDTYSELAGWSGGVTFPLYINEPFTLETKVRTLIKNIYNETGTPQGLTVRFEATGEVVNPSLTDVDRQQEFVIEHTMHAGDVIEVTTSTGNKRVKLIRGSEITNINNKWKYGGKWLQAQSGDNLYRYGAESGIDSLDVSIKNTKSYWGG